MESEFRYEGAPITSLQGLDPERVIYIGTGLHLIAEFSNVEFTEQLLEQALQSGVRLYPVEIHAINKKKLRNQIILGMGICRKKRLRKGSTG